MSAAQSMTKKFAIPTMLVVCGFMGSHNASGRNQSEMRVIDEVTGAVIWKQTTEPAELAVSEPPGIEHLSELHSNNYMVTMSPCGQFMVSAGADRSPEKVHNETFVDGASLYDHCHWTLWDIQTGSSLKVGPSTLKGKFTLAFSQCGTYFATGQSDGRVIIYNANDGVEFKTMDLVDQGIEGHTNQILSVSFSCDGKRIAAARWLQHHFLCDVVIWNFEHTADGDDTEAGRKVVRIVENTQNTSERTDHYKYGSSLDVKFSPVCPDLLAVASNNGHIDIFDITHDSMIRRDLPKHRFSGDLPVNWSPDGLHVVARKIIDRIDGNYKPMGHGALVISVETGKTFQPDCDWVQDAVFVDKNTIAIGSGKTCQVWDLYTHLESNEIQGNLIKTFPCGPVRALAWGRNYVKDQRALAVVMAAHARLEGLEDLIKIIVQLVITEVYIQTT